MFFLWCLVDLVYDFYHQNKGSYTLGVPEKKVKNKKIIIENESRIIDSQPLKLVFGDWVKKNILRMGIVVHM